MSEEATVTILDLLNLALGTPEIGAVNLNLLHRFLLELVKHFSLTRKQIDITDDIAVQAALDEMRLLSAQRSQYQFLGQSSLSESVDERQSSDVKGKESVISDTAVPAVAEKHDESSQRDVKSAEKEVAMKQLGDSTKEKEKEDNEKQVTDITGEMDDKDETTQQTPVTEEKDETTQQTDSTEVKDKKDEVRQQSGDTGEKDKKHEIKQKAASPLMRHSSVLTAKSRSPSPQARSVSATTKASKRSSPGTSRTEIHRKSFLDLSAQNVFQLERKISILEAKIDALGAVPTNVEIVQQARDLQRDSQSSTTAAGDMWHTMNIVRRIEVAEGAIDGITTMLDDINQELRKTKENSFEQRLNDLSNELKNATEKVEHETPAVNDKEAKPITAEILLSTTVAEKLENKVSQVEKMLDNMVSKNDLKSFLTIEKMNEMIDSKIQNLKSTAPTTSENMTKDHDEEQTDNNTDAFTELYMKIEKWSNFRDEISKKVEEIYDSLSNTVDQSALMELKTEINKLVESQSLAKNDQPTEPLVTLQDLQKLKDSMEENLQYANKNLQELKQNLFPFYEMKETVMNIKDAEDLIKCDIENIRKELLKVLKQLDDQQGSLLITI